MDPIFSKELTVYKSPEDILGLRERVLTRIEKFENAMRIRSDALKESKQFLYFEKAIGQYLSLLNDLIDAIPEENIDDFTNIEVKMCKHLDVEAEISVHEIEMENLEQQGLDMIKNFHRKSHKISEKIYEMKNTWQILLSKFTDQIEILRAKQYYVDYLRTYEKITRWINKKTNFLTLKNNFESLESVETYIYDVNQIEKKMLTREHQVEELIATSDFFIKDDLPQSYNIMEKKKNLAYSWEVLKDIISAINTTVKDSIRVHKLCCKVKEFLAWISQKDVLFSNENYGNNLEEHLILLKKHEGMERLIRSKAYRLSEILQEYYSLNNFINTHTVGLIVHRTVVEERWKNLETKVLKRGMMLRTHSKMHQFYVEINCSLETLDEMKSIISAAFDLENVKDADESLQMLAIYRDVILLKEEGLNEVMENGQRLLHHNQQEQEIKKKLELLIEARSSLKDLLDSQEENCKLLLALQLFNRDCEAAADWLEEKTKSLELDLDKVDTLEIVQQSIRKHEVFKKTLSNEKKKVENLIHTEIEIGLLGVLEVERILQKQRELKTRLKSIETKCEEKTNLLEDALKLQLFHYDCDDIQEWIVIKLKILSNEYYLDGTVISGSIASHNLFVNEFTAYSKVIYKLVEREKEMIEKKHHAIDIVKERVKTIVKGWNSLSFETYDKTLKLDEILGSRTFALITTKLEIDLSEHEERLSYQYVYHDGELSNALEVERNLEDLDRDVKVGLRRLHEMQICGNNLIKNGHYESKLIAKKMRQLKARQYGLICTIKKRRKIIEDARAVTELYMDIENQISWMTQVITNLSVVNTELGLMDHQHLASKYKTNTIQFDVNNRDVKNLRKTASKMIRAKHYDSKEILNRIAEVLQIQNQMRKKRIQFKFKLEEAKSIYEYYSEVELNEAIMKEKRAIFVDTNCGRNEDSSTALLRRHETLVEDLKLYGKKIEDLRKIAEKCEQMSLAKSECILVLKDHKTEKPNEISISEKDTLQMVESSNEEKTEDDQGNLSKYCEDDKTSYSQMVSPVIRRQLELEKMYWDLMKVADIRKNRLSSTYEAYRLMREATELKSWIEVKLPFVQQTDVGENLVQVEVLQKTFDDFKLDQVEKKATLIEILRRAEKLKPFLNEDQVRDLSRRTEDVETEMKNLRELMNKRGLQLNTAHELQRYYRNCYEAEEWIREKDEKLNSDDCGESLRSVRTMLRKHEGLEKDLEAIDGRIDELEGIGKYLKRKYPASSHIIRDVQGHLNKLFGDVSRRTVFKKQNLLDSYDRQKFFADHHDLISWIDKMIAIMSSTEGASDYHAAENLRDNFEETCREIFGYEMKIKTVEKYGKMLLNYNTEVKDVIEQKLDKLKESHRLLHEKRNLREMVVTKNLQINSFLWNCEKICYWLGDQEKLLNTSEEDEKHIKTLNKIRKALQKKEEDIGDVKKSAQRLFVSFEEDKDVIMKKRDETVLRWENLKEAVSKKLLELKENQTIKNFTLEVEAVSCWIDEKVQQVLSESRSDPVRIQAKLMKQKAFESEVHEHKERVENLLRNGKDLMQNEKSENLRRAVLKLLKDISEKWNFLQVKTKETSHKIKEVLKQYEHIMALKYMNIWMCTVETTLMNKDLGKNLDVVEELLKQHVILEEEIKIYKDKMEALLKEVSNFKNDSVFDVVSFEDEHKLLSERFKRIEELSEQRKTRLEKKMDVLKFLRSVAEEETWIKEMQALAEK